MGGGHSKKGEDTSHSEPHEYRSVMTQLTPQQMVDIAAGKTTLEEEDARNLEAGVGLTQFKAHEIWHDSETGETQSEESSVNAQALVEAQERNQRFNAQQETEEDRYILAKHVCPFTGPLKKAGCDIYWSKESEKVSDFVPGLGSIVHIGRALAIRDKKAADEEFVEAEFSAVIDAATMAIPVGRIAKGVGTFVKGAGKEVGAVLSKGGGEAVVKDVVTEMEHLAPSVPKPTENAFASISGDAGKEAEMFLFKGLAHGAAEDAAKVALKDTVRAGVEEGEQAALSTLRNDITEMQAKTIAEDAAKKVVKETAKKEGKSTLKTTLKYGAAGVGTAATATTAYALAHPTTAALAVSNLMGGVDTLMHPPPEEDKRRDAYRAARDPLYPLLNNTCHGMFLFTAAGSKDSCTWVKFVSPMVLTLVTFQFTPRNMSIGGRLATGVAVGGAYYVWKEGVFVNFKSNEDDKEITPDMASEVDPDMTGPEHHHHHNRHNHRHNHHNRT